MKNKKYIWGVEFKSNCEICNNLLPKGFRKFCSRKCRHKAESIRYKEYQKEWQRKKTGKYASNKKKCIICGRWYVQVGSHIVQRHKMTAREYREQFNLPVIRGIVPRWYRELKGNQALKNKTFLNLKAGQKYQYRKGDKRAKIVTFHKGRRYKSDDYYE